MVGSDSVTPSNDTATTKRARAGSETQLLEGKHGACRTWGHHHQDRPSSRFALPQASSCLTCCNLSPRPSLFPSADSTTSDIWAVTIVTAHMSVPASPFKMLT